MAPSDDELSAMTGITDLDVAATWDMEMMKTWESKGFTRREAFELLLTLKNTALRHELHIIEDKGD
jgi:hypothetical protein